MLTEILLNNIFYAKTSALLEIGGIMILPLLALTLVMWILIAERCFYFIIKYPKVRKAELKIELRKKDERKLRNRKNRQGRFRLLQADTLTRNLSVIRQCVTLAPLLGLTGTVVGMIEVFDVLNIVGAHNSRLIAKGFSHTTVPSLVGLAIAITGYFMFTILELFAKNELSRFKKHLLSE